MTANANSLAVVALVATGWVGYNALASASEYASLPPGFMYEESEAGNHIMLDGRRAVYWNEREFAAGSVTCVENCLSNWLPVVASANEMAQPTDWSVTTRPDGSAQWSFRGKLLYTNVQDIRPGSRLGIAANWKLLFERRDVPAGMSIQDTLLGRVLADHRGRTLYVNKDLAGDVGGSSPWRRFEAPMLATGQSDWTIERLADGTRQWSFKEQALYLFEKDKDAQDIFGHQVDGTWSAVVLEPPPSLPPWVTIQQVSVGRVYADRDGRSLYAPMLRNSLEGVNTCLDDCMKDNWRPVIAGDDDLPTGPWAIAQNENGELQWTYKGRPLYTSTKDSGPGEMNGDGFGIGYKLFGGWRVIPVESTILPAGS